MKRNISVYLLTALFILSLSMLLNSLLPANRIYADDMPAPWNGTIDTAWYDTSSISFNLTSPEQLAGLAAIVNGTASDITTDTFENKTITLQNDIDLNNQLWTPIGNASSKKFGGTFDGGGYLIEHININATTSYAGFFGNSTGTISNIIIASGTVQSSMAALGTIVGKNTGMIDHCISYAVVINTRNSGTSAAGGLVGQMTGGSVSDCVNYGTITANQGAKSVGGVIGQFSGSENMVVQNCYNRGDVVGKGGNVGGIVGYFNGPGTVQNCYNTGNVSADADFGGVYGANNGKTVMLSNNYFLKTDIINSTLAGESGVTAVNEDELKSAAVLTALGSAYQADNENFNSGYPVLTWQKALEGTEIDKTALETAIATAQGVTTETHWITDDHFNGTDVSENGFYIDMQEVLTSAQLVYANDYATQEQVDTAVADLNAAIARLIPKTKVNATALHEALETYDGIDISSYTAESASAYSAALLNAQNLYNGGEVAQAEYSEAVQADIQSKADILTAAANDLITSEEVQAAETLRVNIPNLTAITGALSETDYTPESWADLTTAVSNAQAMQSITIATKTQADAVQSAYNALWNVYLHGLVDADGVVQVSLRVEGVAGQYGTLYLNDAMSVAVKDMSAYYDTNGYTPNVTPNIAHLIATMWDETGVPGLQFGKNPIDYRASDGYILKLFDGGNDFRGCYAHIYLNGVLIDTEVFYSEIYAVLHEGDEVVLASYPYCDENDNYNQQRYFARFTDGASSISELNLTTGESFNLTVEAKDGYDLTDTYAPFLGLEMFIGDSGALGATNATGIKTDKNGNFSYTFTRPGDYTVEAYLAVNTAKSSTVPARLTVHVTGTDYGDTSTYLDQIINNIASYRITTWTMGVGTLGGDWTNMGMQVYGRPLLATQTERDEFAVQCVARLTPSSWTDYARIGMALGSLGYDVSDLDQYHLDFRNYRGEPVHSLIDELVNFSNDYTLNGPIFALILLDSRDYQIPDDSLWTRDSLIDAVLAYRGGNGSFSLTSRLNGAGSANDTDMTAMALQALAPYRSRADVADAVDKAVAWLSSAQCHTGGFIASAYAGNQGPTSESTSQVIIALCALGIDPAEDDRFVESGPNDVVVGGGYHNHSAVDGLIDFITPDGAGFAHSRSLYTNWGGNRDENAFDSMATDQGFLALLAYQSFLKNGKQPICVYDFGSLSPQSADKSQLARRLNLAQQLTDEGYTEASWTAFMQTVNRAQSIYDNVLATQTQADGALVEINNALASLIPRITSAELSEIIVVLESAFPAEDYDTHSYATYPDLITAIDTARLVAENETATEAEIESIIAALEKAVNGLRVWPSDIDVNVLRALAADAETYIDGDRGYDFFIDNGNAASNGRSAVIGAYIENPDPSQVFFKDSNAIQPITAYKNGTRGLVFKSDTYSLAVLTDTMHAPADHEKYNFSLTNLIARANGLLENAAYTQATRSALSVAIATAQNVFDAYLAGGDGAPTGEQVAAAGTSLLYAINNIQYDHSDLNTLISNAKYLGRNSYELGGWIVLQDRIKIAELVANCYDADITQINEVTVLLNGAIGNLISIPAGEAVKTILNALIAAVNELDQLSYMPASWSILDSAKVNAQAVAGNISAVNDDYFFVIDQLNAAVNGLRFIDKAELNALVVESDNISNAGYTDESWLNFQTALDNAKAVSADENATQTEINMAYAALYNAKTSLVESSPKAPIATDQNLITYANRTLNITLTATDPDEDTLTYLVIEGPVHGNLDGYAPELVYTPEPGFTGIDSFTFKANDGAEDSNIAVININVTGINTSPTEVGFKLTTGWNTFSTPISLEAGHNTLGDILEKEDYELAYSYNSEIQTWELVDEAYQLKPCDAIFIKMTNAREITLVINTALTSPPSKNLYAGWNLVGLANLEVLKASDALTTVEEAQNMRGYAVVLSPSVGAQEGWAYIKGWIISDIEWDGLMIPGLGYWVFMVNGDTLAGLTTTPLETD